MMNKMNPYKPFSVCMSVYKNDVPDFVKMALDSVLAQTIPPAEVIIVRDGQVSPELQGLLDEYVAHYPCIKLIAFDTNQGLGNAMRVAVEEARYDVIARMDSDDIAVPDRFEQQLAFMHEHPEVDLVGGQISEFVGEPENIIAYRYVPQNNEQIYAYMKSRCPINHVTIMAKRQAILAAGNYMEWHYNEDYYLWIRMALQQSVFANLSSVLVNVRTGNDMYQRRGGWNYFKSERGIQRFMLQHRLISPMRYCYNVLGRFVVQILMPNRLRGFVFRVFFRRKDENA